MNKSNDITFGSINVETGETEKGYMEDGVMKFKKLPWYKRLFCAPPTEIKTLTTTLFHKRYIFTGKRSDDFEVPVYIEKNSLTDKIIRIFCSVDGQESDFNIEIWQKQNRLVLNQKNYKI